MKTHSFSPHQGTIAEKIAANSANYISCDDISIGDAAGHRGRDVDRLGGLSV